MSEDKKQQEQMPAWAKELVEQNKALTEKVKMFEDMAGPNAIASYEHSKRDIETKYIHLKIYNNRIIIGWSELDMSKFNPGARTALEENVFTTVTYLDGTTEKINFVTLNRVKDQVKLRVVEHGPQLTKVELPPNIVGEYKLEKKTLSIANKFLNR